MKPHDLARQNAIPLEVKKDGLAQRQSGDWVLRLVVQAADMDQRITNAAMGTRYQVALVEINDDETPKQPEPKKRMDWRELQPAAQAAIRCGEPQFQRYLWSEHGFAIQNKEDAAAAVRNLCGVDSRSKLATNHKARVIWHQIDSQYLQWGGAVA